MRKVLKTALLTLIFCMLLTLAAGAQQTKLIALTFDDGPSPEYSPQVLDILERKNVHATFFLIGKWLNHNDDILKREVADGDQIANHTWGHVKLTGLSDAEIRQSVSDTADKLTAMTGVQGNLMVRPPFGTRDSRVLADINAPVILWSVDPAAGKQVWSQEMVKRVLAKATDGGIILMHDSSQANVNAVEGIIDGLHSKGYEFVTVSELFRLRGVTPQNGVLYQKVVNSNPQNYNESQLAGHWAYSAISDLERDGYMTGDGSGWHPNRYLTRAQAVTVLWRMCGSPAARHHYSFPDVSLNTYYARAAAWAKENGVLKGETNGKFLPQADVTREQLYVILSRLVEEQGKTAETAQAPAAYGDDARIDSWARSGVNTIRAMGFDSVNDREIFRPRDWATRAEAAELFDWYLSLNGNT